MTEPRPPTPTIGRNPKAPERSFASLNFLRGLSAAAVLFSHAANAVSSGKPIFQFNFGSFAVDVFMLISGFLMMWHFYERRQMGEAWGTPKTCLKFYVRRFFRIAPLYYFLLLVVYFFHAGLEQLNQQNQAVFQPTFVPGPNDPTSSAITIGHVFSHFTFTFGFIPCFAQSTPLPDWSIGLEMQFYLFFPFLALLLVRSQFLLGAALLVAAHAVSFKLFGVGVDATPHILGVFPYATLLPFKLDCFATGMLLAAGLYEKENAAKRAFLLLLALLVSGIYMKKFLLICFLFGLYEVALNYGTGLPLVDQTVRRIKGLVEHRIFKFMADASYGVYLIHLPLLTVVVWLLVRTGFFANLPPLARFAFCFLIMVLLVYPLAYIAFKWIETPGIAWGRKIVKRIR